eukprot:TRINITY_DN92108_c0_g1_i1.p1 TRINITY_DN92108_c0_g1~~TRINITY_DN92108_c0_g1_i1.p1  ORF type:complete len:272 (-),score=73.53 TRINITY_DN92108_c0_g1_i1:46-861(-)
MAESSMAEAGVDAAFDEWAELCELTAGFPWPPVPPWFWGDAAAAAAAMASAGGTTYTLKDLSCQVFASGCDLLEAGQDAVRKHFGQVGDILDVRVVRRDAAVIFYGSSEEANRAVEVLNGSTLAGFARYVTVRHRTRPRHNKGKGRGRGRKSAQSKSAVAAVTQEEAARDDEDVDGATCTKVRAAAVETAALCAPSVRPGVKTGVVKRFLEDKGFGYIKPDEGGADIFVHFSAIRGMGYDKLEGLQVRYDVEPDLKSKRKGSVRAVNVERC